MVENGEFVKKTGNEMKQLLYSKHYAAKFLTDNLPGLKEKMEYIVSPGVCNDDIGGPLYFNNDDNDMLLIGE